MGAWLLILLDSDNHHYGRNGNLFQKEEMDVELRLRVELHIPDPINRQLQ